MKHKDYWLALTLAMLLVPGGCIKMGPDFNRPDIGVQTPASYQHDPSETLTPEPEDQWWQVFSDPEINRLVEDVLQNNWDIKKAAAAILELDARFVQTRADRFPSFDLQGEAKRQRSQVIGVVPGMNVSSRTDLYTLSVPASFELDLWGRLARSDEGARADLLRTEESLYTVVQTVVAQTITLYFQVESLERRIQITEESIENFRRSLSLVESRYERGLTSILDLRQARRILAQSEALLPSLRQKLGITQQGLAVLLGRYPETTPPRFQEEDYFKQLSPVPPGLPSELLLRRPDLRAAEAGLKALNARVGAAKASRFPRIALTGTFGYTSDELNGLVKSQNEFWSIAMGIVQPLFYAGKLKAGQRAAEAQYQQGLAEYAQTVLTAFSEVEGSLLTRKEQLERRERVLVFLAEARATQEVAESRYERGLIDYLTVLDAQQARFQAEDNLVLVDLAILSNRVTLHRVLGGGWGDPSPAADEEKG